MWHNSIRSTSRAPYDDRSCTTSASSKGRSAQGIQGMARVIASVVAAMPYVLDDLDEADGQRVIELSLLKAARRHDIFDPQVDVARFPYWQ
jgi:hypothetical protein